MTCYPWLPGVAFIATLIIGTAVVSHTSIWVVRVGVLALPRWLRWVVVSPMVLLHELFHFLVLCLFGLKVTKLDLSGVFCGEKGAYVRFLYNPLSIRHRAALIVSGWAPVFIPMGLVVLWLKFPYVPDAPLEIAAAAYLLIILSGAMGLSDDDWHSANAGLLVICPTIFLLSLLIPNGAFDCPQGVMAIFPALKPVLILFGAGMLIQGVTLCLFGIFLVVGKLIKPAPQEIKHT